MKNQDHKRGRGRPDRKSDRDKRSSPAEHQRGERRSAGPNRDRRSGSGYGKEKHGDRSSRDKRQAHVERGDNKPQVPHSPVARRRKVDLPIKGPHIVAPAWIGRLDHPFTVEPGQVREIVHRFDESLDPEPFYQHLKLVQSINADVNLVSRANVDAVLLQSLWESLIPLKDKVWQTGPHVLDLGTGGGFPGLPLAISLPDTEITLLDSRRAKTLSLQKILSELGIGNVKVVHDRAETFADRIDEPFDTIVVRAVSTLPELTGWSEGLLKSGGYLLAWKGPEGEKEAKSLSERWELTHALRVLPHRYVLVLKHNEGAGV